MMPPTPTPEPLTRQQELALGHMLAGKSISDAAKEVDADRTTLHRWLREDPHFQATYNQRRRELQEAHQTRLSAIVAKALQTVEQAVENGDVGTAMKLLTGLGLLSGEAPRIGPEDPRDVERHLRSREERWSDRKKMDELQEYVGSWYKDTIRPLMELTDVGTSMKRLSGHGLLSGEAPRIGPEDPKDAKLDQRSREERGSEREKMTELQDYLRSSL